MKIRPLLLYVLILFALPLLSYSQSFQPEERTRIIVLTDIENEPDDAQSLVRFLSYANHFEIEGIIATTSIGYQIRQLNGVFMKFWMHIRKYNLT